MSLDKLTESELFFMIKSACYAPMRDELKKQLMELHKKEVSQDPLIAEAASQKVHSLLKEIDELKRENELLIKILRSDKNDK